MEYNITYRQKDKGWQYIISYKLNGQWKQKSKQGFKTKKEAKPAAEHELLKLKDLIKREGGILNDNADSIKFSSLFNLFIEHIKLYREGNTIESYKIAYAKFQSLSDMKVKDIKKIHLQKCVDDILKAGVKSSSIGTYIRKIKQCFIYYKDNYNETYELPTTKLRLPEAIPAVKKALTIEETDTLLKDMKGSKYYIFILLCLRCGLRRGEALGLTWNDLDEVNISLNINKQWKKHSDGSWAFGETKNKKHRIVPISTFVLNELKEYKKNSIIDINNRIFPHSGVYISQYLNKVLKPYGITIHELRHTYTTHLISHGVDFKTAAEIIGDSVEMVLRVYSHVNNDMMRQATNIIRNIF